MNICGVIRMCCRFSVMTHAEQLMASLEEKVIKPAEEKVEAMRLLRMGCCRGERED